jgi:hypothetical protein
MIIFVCINMNCEIELVEKYLRKEFPYVVKIKEFIIGKTSPLMFSGMTANMGRPTHSIYIYIKQSFFDQLENNGPLKSSIFNSFSNECAQIIKSVCPEIDIVTDNDGTNLAVTFLPEEVI